MTVARPQGMSPQQLTHELRVIALLTERYGVARLLEIETYTYTLERGGCLTWDITKAQAWVAEQRQGHGVEPLAQRPPPRLFEVPRVEQARMATQWDIDELFVATADPSQPGICAPIIDQDQDPPLVCYVLIDGIHRSVKAYREGRRFWAVVLPDDVSRDCLLDAPDGSVP